MQRHSVAMGRPVRTWTAAAAGGLLAPALLAGSPVLASCGRQQVLCAGQCAPPYHVDVIFKSGTSLVTARKVLTSCAAHNPVVIRVGRLRHLGDGVNEATVYTHAFGDTARTSGLLTCLRSSGVARLGWPG
jgi:hypothetical protein